MHAIIQVQSKEEAEQGLKLFADAPAKFGMTDEEFGRQLIRGRLTHMGILEAGMQSGKTSVMLMLEITMPNGAKAPAIVELSADMFQSMNGAVSGARERFGGK